MSERERESEGRKRESEGKNNNIKSKSKKKGKKGKKSKKSKKKSKSQSEGREQSISRGYCYTHASVAYDTHPNPESLHDDATCRSRFLHPIQTFRRAHQATHLETQELLSFLARVQSKCMRALRYQRAKKHQVKRGPLVFIM